VKVIYPYTNRRTEESTIALVRFCPQAERIYVGESDFEYGILLEQLWSAGETFMLVEHDIVIHEGLVEEFAACPEEWCSSPYTYFDQPVTTSGGGLGCTKFAAELMARWPEMMAQANALSYPNHPNGHWCTRDVAIYQLLRRGGLGAQAWPTRRHQTHTEVGHRSGKCSHGCKEEL
jgi:hypothetical protein